MLIDCQYSATIHRLKRPYFPRFMPCFGLSGQNGGSAGGIGRSTAAELGVSTALPYKITLISFR